MTVSSPEPEEVTLCNSSAYSEVECRIFLVAKPISQPTLVFADLTCHRQCVGLEKHFYSSGYSLTKLLGVPTVGKSFFLVVLAPRKNARHRSFKMVLFDWPKKTSMALWK